MVSSFLIFSGTKFFIKLLEEFFAKSHVKYHDKETVNLTLVLFTWCEITCILVSTHMCWTVCVYINE